MMLRNGAKKQFEEEGRMPEIDELVIARKFINKSSIWVWSNTEYDLGTVDYFGLYNGYFGNCLKAYYGYYVFAFLDIPIIDIM